MAETPQNNDSQSVDNLASKSEYFDQASIEQRPATAFNFNAPKPIINPIYPIQDHVTGVSPNYYPSQVQQDVSDPVAKGKALFDLTMNKVNGAQDRNRYGYAYGFDGGMAKGTLRDRYKAYGQETFDKMLNTSTTDPNTKVMVSSNLDGGSAPSAATGSKNK